MPDEDGVMGVPRPAGDAEAVAVSPETGGPAVMMPDENAAAQAAAIEAKQPIVGPVNLAVAIPWSFGLAIVGAAIWAAITEATNFQLGIVAIVVGVLAGYGASRGGRGQATQLVGALAGAFGYFLGQTAIIAFQIVNQMPAGSEIVYHHTGRFLAITLPLVAKDTFSSLGVVFLGIAVWEGWRIPRGR